MKALVVLTLLGSAAAAHAANIGTVPTFQMPTQGIQSIAFYHGCMFGVLSTDPGKKTEVLFQDASKFCKRTVTEAEIDASYRNKPGVSMAMERAFQNVDIDLRDAFLPKR